MKKEKPPYDYLIIGGGLYGSVFAHEMTKWGKKSLLIEKRNYLGGTCYSENRDGIDIHMHGPHIFHTSSKKIWTYINKFADFNNYRHTVKASFNGKLYSFPINLTTLRQVFGNETDSQLLERFEEECSPFKDKSNRNVEDWCLAHIGPTLFKIFIKEYTYKHWRRHPCELSSEIIQRLPIRKNYDDNYFDHLYQGIPIKGYNEIFRRMLKGVDVRYGCDYFSDQQYWDKMADKIIYTGEIDRFFDYRFGQLGWRSLRFMRREYKTKNYQKFPVINYTDRSTPYIRSVEYRHFLPEITKDIEITHTVREYPADVQETGEVYYPVPTYDNVIIYNKYKNMAQTLKGSVIFGGRLARFQYIDMAPTIQMALEAACKEKKLAYL